MEVRRIKKEETHQWILNRHYAKRIPSISHAFGLYNHMELLGVVTYGMPPNYMEVKMWEPYKCMELNRLVVEDCSPENSASFLVGNSIKLLPKPMVIISYADTGVGHIGYVYQATNWIYTGIGGDKEKIYIMKNGEIRHQRHSRTMDKQLIDRKERASGKHRYYYFHANKRDKRAMGNMLRYKQLPYPKGDTLRYDASCDVEKQGVLFLRITR